MAYQSEIEKLQRRYEEKPEQWFAAYADAYRKAGELDVALEIVRSGIEERPNYVSGYIVLGRCLVDQGNDSEAQEAFEQVLALDAENIIALSNLGEVSERAGDVTGARRWLERLLEVDPMNDKARHSLARLATMPSPAPESVEAEEAPPAAEPAPTEEPAHQFPSVDADVAPTAPVEEEPSFGSEPPIAEAVSDADREPSMGAVPEPNFADPVEAHDRFAPAEPGPDLVSADEEPATPVEEEDVSSVFGAAPSEPEASAPEDRRDRSQFFIERQSDPFETQSQAQEAQHDAAALWATLGEDPDLESVPDADSTQGDSAVAQESSDDVAFRETEAEQPKPASAEASFDAPTAPPISGTTQMAAAELNALVERERQEAQERDRASATNETRYESDSEAGDEEGEELIGGPPPEYQLERPEPRQTAESVPLFADPDPLAGDSRQDDVEAPVQSTTEADLDDPELVMPSSLEPQMAPEADDTSGIEEPEPASQAGAGETDDVVTETMAEVYAAQGLFAEAKDVYRKLLERRPGDAEVEARLAAIENRERESTRASAGVVPEAPAEAPSGQYAAARTGGVSARAFLAKVLGELPQGIAFEDAPEQPAATTVLDETFASDRADSQGQPTQPAGDEMSLASVFGDSTADAGEHRRPSTEHVSPPPPPPPPQSAASPSSDDLDLSFDSFFSNGEENKAGSPGDEDVQRDDDDEDEDFKAWLKSLKS